MNLGTFKGKKVAAQKGYDLLKSKADALKVCQCAGVFLVFVPYVESVAVHCVGPVSRYLQNHPRY
jgi:hypothetical protein